MFPPAAPRARVSAADLYRPSSISLHQPCLQSIFDALGAAGGTLETGLTFAELIGEELDGKEWREENIRDILNNPDKLNEIRRRAATRGAVIGVVDMFTGKLAGRVGAKIMSKGTKAAKASNYRVTTHSLAVF